VMTQVSCGTRRAAIANWWWRRDRTAMFGRHANTWLIIATTYHQNWLPIIPDNSQVGKLSRIIGKNWNPDNSRFFPGGSPNNGISLGGILFYFWSFPWNAEFLTFCGVSQGACSQLQLQKEQNVPPTPWRFPCFVHVIAMA
jgi:hypothetical protein